MIAQIAFENGLVWVFGLPLAVAVLLLSAWSHWRDGRSRHQIAALAGLRLLACLILLALVARPVRIDPEEESSRRNRVVLLVDKSQSMSLAEEGESRYRQTVGFARDDLLPALKAADIGAEAFLFAEDAVAASGPQISTAVPEGKQTNLARAIARSLVQAEQPPLAVIALTDGATTEDADNSRAISALVESRAPFIGVGFGDETGTRVLSLEEVVAPPVVSPSQEFQISARLRATAEAELPHFVLTLMRDGQFVEQKPIHAGSGARVWQESFQVTENDEGLHSYAVQLLPPDDPTVKCPNREATVAVRISDEKELRVLFVQGGLTWDYKFIRLAILGDPTIKLSGPTRVSSRSRFLQSVENATELVGGFPSTIEDLAKFRVVVLSNLTPSDLTPAQQERLARFCRELGGGVLMIGGAKTFNASWQDSHLEQLLPVSFARVPGPGTYSGPFHLRINESALAHPVFQITDAGNNRGAWASLPAFTHFAAVDSVKPGAQVWAVHSSWPNANSQQPLMAAQRYGAGLSAVICVQNCWRWRLARESNPQHFDRFWQQLFRYLAEGSRQSVLLRLPDQRLRPGADVRVDVQRRPDPREGSTTDSYRLRATDEDNQILAEKTLEIGPGQSAVTTFRVEEPGLLTLSVLDQQGNLETSRSLEITESDDEFLNTARNMETLRQWASLSGGTAIRSEDHRDVGRLIDEIEASLGQSRRTSMQSAPLGMNGWVLSVLLGCLCAEWLLRKRWKLT